VIHDNRFNSFFREKCERIIPLVPVKEHRAVNTFLEPARSNPLAKESHSVPRATCKDEMACQENDRTGVQQSAGIMASITP
jgi:hypothetical protein